MCELYLNKSGKRKEKRFYYNLLQHLKALGLRLLWLGKLTVRVCLRLRKLELSSAKTEKVLDILEQAEITHMHTHAHVHTRTHAHTHMVYDSLI